MPDPMQNCGQISGYVGQLSQVLEDSDDDAVQRADLFRGPPGRQRDAGMGGRRPARQPRPDGRRDRPPGLWPMPVAEEERQRGAGMDWAIGALKQARR